MITTSDNRLQDVIGELFPAMEPPARARMIEVVKLTAEGMTWTKVENQTKMPWAWLSLHLMRSTRFRDVWKAARDTGDEVRHLKAVAELERRAVEGYEENVYSPKTGALLGTVRRFSDRLLEFVTKAGDRQKYGDKQTVEHRGDAPASIVYHIHGVQLGVQPPPRVYDVTAASESATKARPETIEPSKPLQKDE